MARRGGRKSRRYQRKRQEQRAKRKVMKWLNVHHERIIPYAYHHPAPRGRYSRNARSVKRINIADLPPLLAGLVVRYSLAVPFLKKPTRAYCNCGRISQSFMQTAWDHGVDAAVFNFGAQGMNALTTRDYPEFYGYPDVQHAGGPSDHAVVVMFYKAKGRKKKAYFIDWTARQYNAKAPWPLIWTQPYEDYWLSRATW